MTVYEEAGYFGSLPQRRKDWFTEDLLPLIEDKCKALQSVNLLKSVQTQDCLTKPAEENPEVCKPVLV